MTLLILSEKPSAAKNFAKALGGMSGTYDGKAYQIHALFGHMMEYVEPHEMVDGKDMQIAFQSWKPDSMPWPVSEMNWKRKPQMSYNPRTKKKSSKAGDIAEIKKIASNASAIVIATDKDPSGEGQLIGWEVIQAIGWGGPVKRLYFIDESEASLQKGFRDMVDLPHYSKDGEYVKAETRTRWDFISMQLTRLSTDAARMKGYNVKVVRQGRLKSVMTKLVADQLARVKAYKKKPYYEVKYKDDKGNTYARKFEDGDEWRFDARADAEADMKAYGPSAVVQDSKTRKETAPGKLLDLGGLASILGTKGYKSKEVLQTYQKMYEAKIVSYPRTEDKFISTEQFKEMLPLVDSIAGVVGADTALLTHRAPRKTHVKDGGAHGANRPGTNVPASLDAVSKYGPSARAIYETLAKNFLAMFGENYVYDAIKGHIADHPAFTASVSVPVDMGFKAIFDADKESSDETDDDDNKDSKGLGAKGSPVVAEGVNKKPPHPTHKWLERQLSKYDVGTGATRVSTLSDVTAGVSALLTDTKGKLNLTHTGEIAAALLEGSRIGNPAVTEKLLAAMDDAGAFKVKDSAVLDTATDIVKHDKEVFYRNAERLKDTVGEPEGGFVQKEKVTGIFKPMDKKVSFNKTWGGYTFTDDEVAALLAGETIRIKGVNPKSGRPYTADGRLSEGEYKGRKFWGFTPKRGEDYTIQDAPIPIEWSGYVFTDADVAALRAGEKVHVDAISKKTGNPFSVDVSFELTDYKGNVAWRIKPHFEERKPASAYTRETAPMPAEWSGYKFSDADAAALRAGEKVAVEAVSKKTGKPFKVDVSFDISDYKGVEAWRIQPHFEERKPASEYTRENAPFKPVFSGYELTDAEIRDVRAGGKVMVTATSKKGKEFTCNLSLELKEFKGRKFWGLEAHFD